MGAIKVKEDWQIPCFVYLATSDDDKNNSGKFFKQFILNSKIIG